MIVMNEFFSQGDVERKLGHKLSMNCDRVSVSVSKCQLGFGNYVIRSLLQLLEKLVYTAGIQSLENFEQNHKHWEEIAKKEAESGKPYLIKLNPPSKEGGWLGELREGEQGQTSLSGFDEPNLTHVYRKQVKANCKQTPIVEWCGRRDSNPRPMV